MLTDMGYSVRFDRFPACSLCSWACHTQRVLSRLCRCLASIWGMRAKQRWLRRTVSVVTEAVVHRNVQAIAEPGGKFVCSACVLLVEPHKAALKMMAQRSLQLYPDPVLTHEPARLEMARLDSACANVVRATHDSPIHHSARSSSVLRSPYSIIHKSIDSIVP